MRVQILLLIKLIAAQACDVFNVITTPNTPIRTKELLFANSQDFGMGIWTRFNPSITRFSTELQEVERMLVFFQSNKLQSEYYTIYSIKYDQKAGTMFHEVYLYIGESFQVYSLPIKASSTILTWIFLYICRSSVDSKYSIFTYFASEREFTQMGTGINGLWKPIGTYYYQVGKTLECQNQFIPQTTHSFTIFRGQISDLYFENADGAAFDNIPAFITFIEGLTCLTPEPCPNKKIVELLAALTVFDGHGFVTKKVESKLLRYLISGWAKTKPLDSEIRYNSLLMRATINPNYQQNQKQGDRAFLFEYRQHMQPDLNGFYISTYSTNANPTKDDYSSTPEDEWLELGTYYEQALTTWHFFTFQYGLSDPVLNTKLEIFFAHQQQTKTKFFHSRNQLADQTYYFQMGGDKFTQASLFRGEMSNIQFEYCFNTDQNPNKPCHYSCAQCLGPTKQECNLCADPMTSNRELIPSTGECQCKPNFIDRDEQQNCEDASQAFDFVSIAELELPPSCNYGEFSVNGEFCMLCPQQVQTDGYYCGDCWMSPRTWYLQPKCTFDYLLDDPNSLNNFIKQVRSTQDQLFFTIDKLNRKLIPCEGCEYDQQNGQTRCKPCYKQISSGACKFYGYNCQSCNNLTNSCLLCNDGFAWTSSGCLPCTSHCKQCQFDEALQKMACTKCESNFGLDEGQCTQCGQYCSTCERQILGATSLMKCYTCEDPHKYLLSFDGQNCRLNIIENCLIAVQTRYKLGYYYETSLNVNITPSVESAYFTVCLRCKPGFINNHNLNLCIPSTNYDETIITDLLTINLGENSDPTLNQVCKKLCKKCIANYINDQEYCLNCDYGYYSDKISGTCNPCTRNLNCRTCSHYNVKYQDNWKWSIRADYFYYIGKGIGYPFFGVTADTTNRHDNIVFCTSCKLGYIFYKGACIKNCHSSCKRCVVVDYKSQCVECKSSIQGQMQSVENGECISCSQNCQACRTYQEAEVKQINPYFDLKQVEHKSQSNQCLKQFSLPDLYYDWELTQFVKCAILRRPCFKRARVSFFAYCNDQMFETSRLSAADIEAFDKSNLKLSTVFNFKGESSFPQIENDEFYQIMSEKQVKEFEITLNLVYDGQGKCQFSPFSQVATLLKKNIFTAQIIMLEIVGNQDFELELNSDIVVLNFEIVRFKNLKFSLVQNTLIQIGSLKEQKVYFENVRVFSQTPDFKQLLFSCINIQSLHISNFYLEDAYISNSNGIFNYGWSQLEYSKIFEMKVENFRIIRSKFQQSKLFLVNILNQNVLQNIQFKQLEIRSSAFSKSSLINTKFEVNKFSHNFLFESFSLTISELEVEDAIFIQLQGLRCKVQSVFVEKSKVTRSILFEIDIFTFSALKFAYNYFQEGQIINSELLASEPFENFISDAAFQFNQYTNGMAFIRCVYPDQVIILRQILVQSNSVVMSNSVRQQPILAKISLIFLDVKIATVEHMTITRAQGYPELSIMNAQSLYLDDFSIALDQLVFMETLHSSIECLSQSLIEQQYTTFLFLYAIKKIAINQMRVNGLISINQPLIVIQSLGQVLLVQHEEISITRSTFTQNALIATKIGVEQSILAIYSQQYQEINLIESLFELNHQHCYFQDITFKSSSTIIIQSPLSQVKLVQNKFKSCLITNNKGSTMNIRAKELLLKNSDFENLNSVSYDDLKRNIIWGSEERYFEENLLSFLNIESQGGAAYLNIEVLQIETVVVRQSRAVFGGAFYIEIKDLGVVSIRDSTFQETSASLDQWASSQGGALYINSAPGQLNLMISGSLFENTFSRKQGGGIYINPSPQKNSIKVVQNTIRNSNSFAGSFLFITSTQVINPESLVAIIDENIIENNDAGLFFSRVVGLTDEEVGDFAHTYFFDISGGTVAIRNNQVDALHLNGFLKTQGIFGLSIQQMAITNTQLMAQPMITIRPQKYHFGNIKLEGLTLYAFSQYSLAQTSQTALPEFRSQAFYCQKAFRKPSSLDKFYSQDYFKANLKNNLQRLVAKHQSIKSVLMIEQLTSSWFVELTSIHIEMVQCQICTAGLFQISGIDFPRGRNLIKFSDSIFNNNRCGSEGCVKIKQTLSSQIQRLLNRLDKVYSSEQTLEIRNARFFSNQAHSGAGLYLQGIDALIIATTFNKNLASNAGGAIYFLRSGRNESLILVETEFTNNNAAQGGALHVSDYNLNKPNLLNVLLYGNNAEDFGNNLVQPPYQLTVSLNKGIDTVALKSISTDLKARIDMIQIPSAQETQILVPSGQTLSRYSYFDSLTQNYTQANLSLRVIPLNSQGSRMKQLSNTQCTLDSRMVDLHDLEGAKAGPFSFDFTNLRVVNFNETSQDYNFDNLIVKFSPQLRFQKALQLRFQCDSVKIPIFDESPPYLLKEYATNYSLLMNVQTFYCQQGEFMFVENNISLCEICDSAQDFYSVVPGQKCRIKDQNTMLTVTAARIELRSEFWRPSENSESIEYCRNLQVNCLGGWNPGDKSCFQGHIGALCEQCDLYNIRGEGAYSTSTIYKCGSCSEVGDNITKLVLISLWTMISIMMSVTSTLEANLVAALGNKFKKIGIQVNPRSGISGILIKVFTNYLQIISTIATFQLKLPTALTSSVTSVGNPMESMSYSLDCFLIDVAKSANIEIIYFRVIWGFMMPILYILVYFAIQGILVLAKKAKPNSGIVSTTFVYMYIYLQPTIIGGLASLISFREIAGIVWIQGNVSYKYDTGLHQSWLLYFLIPFLLLFTLVLPIYMLAQLYMKRAQLDEFQVRQKWGYLYNEYNSRSYFWEILKMCQKSLIIIFLTFYEDLIVIKAAMMFIIVFIYQLLSKAVQPYTVAFLNRFDDESSIVCGLSIVMGITIYAANLSDNQEVIWPFYVILIAGNGYFIFRLLLELVRAQLEQNQEALDKLRDKVNAKFPWLKEIRFLQVYLLQNRRQQQIRIAERFKQIRIYLKNQSSKRSLIIKIYEKALAEDNQFNCEGKQDLITIKQESEDDSPEIQKLGQEGQLEVVKERQLNSYDQAIPNTMAILSDSAIQSEPSEIAHPEPLSSVMQRVPQSTYWSKDQGQQSEDVLQQQLLVEEDSHSNPRTVSENHSSSENRSGSQNQDPPENQSLINSNGQYMEHHSDGNNSDQQIQTDHQRRERNTRTSRQETNQRRLQQL